MKIIDGFPALEGAGNYPFVLLVDGLDLLVRAVVATWFGGDDDENDNGETASGVMTKGNPFVLGCALPLNLGPCAGSPIPVLPYRTTQVRVSNRANGAQITVPLIDLGPSPPPLAEGIIDLTQETSRRLNGGRRDNLHVDFRIIGGRQYLPAEIQAAVNELEAQIAQQRAQVLTGGAVS